MSQPPGTSQGGAGSSLPRGREDVEGSYSFPIHRKLRREGRHTVSETSSHSEGRLPLPGEAGCQGRARVRPASKDRVRFPKRSRRAWDLYLFLRGTAPPFRANRSEARFPLVRPQAQDKGQKPAKWAGTCHHCMGMRRRSSVANCSRRQV